MTGLAGGRMRRPPLQPAAPAAKKSEAGQQRLHDLPVLPKPPAPDRDFEFVHHVEAHLEDRHHHELGDAVEGLRVKLSRPRFHTDTMISPGSRNRSAPPGCPARCRICGRGRSAEDHRRQPGIGQVDNHPGRHQDRPSRRQVHGGPRQARRSRPAEPGWRNGAAIPETGIRDADVDTVHQRSSRSLAMCSISCRAGHPWHPESEGGRRHRPTDQAVVVAAEAVLDEVGGDQGPFLVRLTWAYSSRFPLSAAKPTQNGGRGRRRLRRGCPDSPPASPAARRRHPLSLWPAVAAGR